MNLHYCITILLLCIQIYNTVVYDKSNFTDRPTHKQKTIGLGVSLYNVEHYRLFPKSLGDVLSMYSVRELHMSMTQGLWRHGGWGYPVVDAAPGAELWVWFNNHTASVEQRWRQLTNTLSGLFCASLNFMDAKSTMSPQWSLRPSGLSSTPPDPAYLKYSALPHELVCTENLTPWKKLLPCGSKAGLTHLFNAIKLYDSDYHSLGVHFRPVCQSKECTAMSLELSLSLTVVFNPSRDFNTLPSWSLRRLFGKSLVGKCPFASTSKVYVDNDFGSRVTISPKPSETLSVNKGGNHRTVSVYDIAQHTANNDRGLNIEAKYGGKVDRSGRSAPPLTAHRFSTGYGLERGGLTCHLHNHLPTPLTVIYMDSVPWFIRLYYNTLSVSANGQALTAKKINYQPSKDRIQPHLLELTLTLPPQSTTIISIQFQRAFLKWTEYPPDANHGFYINSAVISTMLPGGEDYRLLPQISAHLSNLHDNTTHPQFLRLHTESLLVSLPTPDFSMPYNVICLTCTVVAIAFGSIHNLTTRDFRIADPNVKTGILAKLKRFLQKLRKGKKGKGNDDCNGEDKKDNETLDDCKSDETLDECKNEKSETSES